MLKVHYRILQIETKAQITTIDVIAQIPTNHRPYNRCDKLMAVGNLPPLTGPPQRINQEKPYQH